MNTNRDALGFDVSKPNASKTVPTYGKGEGHIQFLRVVGYISVIVIAVGGCAIGFPMPSSNGAAAIVFGSIITALILLPVIMVYLDMAANVKAAADNTAILIERFDELKDE